jgi:hypothetical protein
MALQRAASRATQTAMDVERGHGITRWAFAAIAYAAFAAACAPPPAHHYPVLVRIESDPAVPLAGAVLTHDGRALGTSDADGLLALTLSGPVGEQVALEVACPPGFRSSDPPMLVVLRAVADPARRPEYRARCRPELRSLVVTVRAPNAVHVPLRYLGKEIARTDAQGAANALLRLAPNESAKLLLDTSAPEHRWLRPQNPELKVSMPDRDDVVLFEQPFVVDAPKKPRPPAPEPDLPRRF